MKLSRFLVYTLYACLLIFLNKDAIKAQAKLSPKREFRGVWIATLNNIDWPSSSSLSPQQQQEEFATMATQLKDAGFNALVVQIRPSADAFYRSPYEPWSAWLTGVQGKAPEPFYDPLEFMTITAHRLGMELHAWINPFRAVSNIQYADIARGHITLKKPEWFVTYGNVKYFNPGLPEARDYIVSVISDVVARYDVDAIHFDDYFYPYPEAGKEFEDMAAFQKYKPEGEKMRNEWRRQNVNHFMEAVSKSIMSIKPHVKLGVSPYGIWRETNVTVMGSQTSANQSSYDHLFADVRLWLQKGWIDYVAPQIYYSTAYKKVPYQALAEWWSHNTFGRHLYIGQAAYKADKEAPNAWGNTYQEILSQMLFNRRKPAIHGSIFYSLSAMMKQSGMIKSQVSKNYYQYPALIPAMPWKGKTRPSAPGFFEVQKTASFNLLKWAKEVKGLEGGYFVLYRFVKGEIPNIEDPAKILSILPADTGSYRDGNLKPGAIYQYAITSVDRLHNESSALLFEEGKPAAQAMPLALIPEHPKVNYADLLEYRKLFDKLLGSYFEIGE